MQGEILMTNTVYFMPDVWGKMMYWTKKTQKEISGIGLAIIEDGKFIITEVMIPPLTTGESGKTRLNAKALVKVVDELSQKNEAIRLWWHTHANGSVFWSPTDKTAMDSFKPDDWFINVVVNHKGENMARILVGIPDSEERMEIDASVEIIPYYHEGWEKEFKDNFTEIEYEAKPTTGYKNVHGWGSGWDGDDDAVSSEVAEWKYYENGVNITSAKREKLKKLVEKWLADTIDIIELYAFGRDVDENIGEAWLEAELIKYPVKVREAFEELERLSEEEREEKKATKKTETTEKKTETKGKKK